MPIYPENFVSNSLSGTILVTNGFANISLPTNPFALEGDKNFVIRLRKGGVNGLVIATSPTITVRDTSQLISLTANISTVAEGNVVVFTLVTANAPDNSNVFYSVLPVTANVNTADFSSANVGKATIVGNQATFILAANADNSLVSEAGETFKIQLRENSATGNIIFTTSNVIISDVSKRANVYSFVESSSSIAEGSSVTFTIFAHNLPTGNLLYYYTTGNADISGANSGTVAINNTSNTVTITTSGSVPANQTRAFNLILSESSLGTAVATSNTITVVDTAGAYLSATGGTVTTTNGYRVHTFNSSNTFEITNLSTAVLKTLDILSIAGGGGGGRGRGGGGGGGGFVLQSNITADANLTVVIGAGGNGANLNVLKLGTNTTVSGGSVNIISVGGGGGGAGSTGYGVAGMPGGSGGGGSTSVAPGLPSAGGAGFGFPSPTQQGFPGSPDAGGGGGAGQTGFNSGPPSAPTGDPARGGNGRPSTITGANVIYAGGGGGKGVGTSWPGGTGGGGASAPENTPYAPSGTPGTVNTGGGGGAGVEATASAGGNGGSGVVIIRYPWVPPAVFSNVTANSGVVLHGSNVFFVVNTGFANTAILFYDTVGNVTTSNFVGGNTGSFTVTSNATVLRLGTVANIPSSQTRDFQLRIREDSATGNIVLTSSNVLIVGNNYAQQYIEATGGNVTTIDGFRVHTFNASGTLSITNASTVLRNDTEVLVVAGGGGGQGFNPGGYFGSGGGAGGFVPQNITLHPNVSTITITIGAGGSTGNPQGSNGSNTTVTGSNFNSITAVGGGGGGGVTPVGATVNGRNGGSGGGGGGPGGGGSGFGWPSPTQQGNPGGDGIGGGGGAGSGGGTGPQLGGNSAGGNGRVSSITGTPTYYAGGGGGATYTAPNPGGAGGLGGGGDGSSGNPAPSTGTVNTGGGGAGTSGGTGGSGVVFIRYPWAPPAVFSNVTANVSGITEGSNAFFVVNTTFANAQTLYYDTIGNVTSSNFVGGNTGSFTITSNATVLRLETVSNIPTDESRVFALRIREDSATGNIILTSSNVILVDANISVYIQATGGNVFTADGYRTHIFTSSNNFTVTNAGILGGNIEYFMVAGGGGGGRPVASSGGGGGAGGVLFGNSAVVANTYVVTVGGGGAGSALGPVNPVGGNGGNTSIIGATVIGPGIAAVGGGGAGGGGLNYSNPNSVKPGVSGGSGGGGSGDYNPAGPSTNGIGGGGFGFPGTIGSSMQGFPGGTGFGGSPATGGAGGGGAGGRAANVGPISISPFPGGVPAPSGIPTEAGGPGGIGISSPLSPSIPGFFGTPGPSAGRWFAGGGGGGGRPSPGGSPTDRGLGGAGGGGNGALGQVGADASAGNVNTGGGGGGGGGGPVGESPVALRTGGSGIVIIRYPYG